MTTPNSQRRYYRGLVSDTKVWDQFQHRSGDVFICVPPKSGTTWMQVMCGLLIFGDPDSEIAFPDLSPWIEFSLGPNAAEKRLAVLEAQDHQRFIKSHSPLDAVPYFEDCTYLLSYRHPLDVHFSMRNHVQNMRLSLFDDLYTDDIHADFAKFLYNDIDGEGFDQPSLELIAHHLTAARAVEHLPNVHLFHYATTSQDLKGQMQRVASAIGARPSPATFERLVQKATFKSMKENAHLTAPGATNGLYKDASNFFESGSGRKWEGKLTADEVARYDQKMASLLDPTDIRFLETGIC